MTLRIADQFARSDMGMQRRGQEDANLARAPLFVVADGMGGARAGEIASQTAVELFADGVPDGPEAIEQRLAHLVEVANERIHALAQEDARRAGMGTTCTAAYVGDKEISIAHVGDSRAYLLRGTELTRLTEDHSLVEALVREGKLTPEEAEDHPQRSIITRALGPEPQVEVDTVAHRARDGDVYLLCSDGLTSMVGEARVRELLLSTEGGLDQVGKALIDAANSAGGRDNITVVLFRLEDTGGRSAAAPPPDAAASDPEQPTTVGTAAPTAEQVRAALRDAGSTPAARLERRLPRLPGTTDRQARRAGRARPLLPIGARVALFALALVAAIGAAGWLATQTIYFVGADRTGQVAIFRGVPYDLPAGLRLYRENFVSGVTLGELPNSERRRLLDHTLRSHNDAADLVRRLELGQIEAR